MIFILNYDRSQRRILSLDEFNDDEVAQADALRAKLEEQFRARNDVEIVTLGSANLATLRITHGRYFLTGEELVAVIEQLIA